MQRALDEATDASNYLSDAHEYDCFMDSLMDADTQASVKKLWKKPEQMLLL